MAGNFCITQALTRAKIIACFVVYFSSFSAMQNSSHCQVLTSRKNSANFPPFSVIIYLVFLTPTKATWGMFAMHTFLSKSTHYHLPFKIDFTVVVVVVVGGSVSSAAGSGRGWLKTWGGEAASRGGSGAARKPGTVNIPGRPRPSGCNCTFSIERSRYIFLVATSAL